MTSHGLLPPHDPLRVAVRIAGAPVRPAILTLLGESLSQAVARHLMTLPPPADQRAMQAYLTRSSMPRVVVEPSRQKILFEFHNPDGRFGMSRPACAHWFELSIALYAEDHAVIASRTARAPVRIETASVAALLRASSCRDLVVLDDVLYWVCRTAPEVWADGVRKPMASLSYGQRAHVEQVRRSEVVDCPLCSRLIDWQRRALETDLPASFLDGVQGTRLADLLRLLVRVEGGRQMLARVLCAAVNDPRVDSTALARAIGPWLLLAIRGSNVQPADLGKLDAWVDRAVECPAVLDVLGRLFRGASSAVSAMLVDWAGQLLAHPATRASFRAVLAATINSDDALDPMVVPRLAHRVEPPGHPTR